MNLALISVAVMTRSPSETEDVEIGSRRMVRSELIGRTRQISYQHYANLPRLNVISSWRKWVHVSILCQNILHS